MSRNQMDTARERLVGWARRCSFQLQLADYGLWLPASASVPTGLGLRMCKWRGSFNRVFNRDWIELSVGFPYIADRAAQGYRTMFPGATSEQVESWVLGRYQTVAREEHEAQLAVAGRLLAGYRMHSSPVLHNLAASRTQGRGLVVLMPHMDNLFLTCVLAARVLGGGNLVTSAVVEHPQIHARLRRFYRDKYAAYEALLEGGRFMHTSGDAKAFFYSALQNGEAVFILTDTPAATSGSGCWVPWFGGMRRVPSGALNMAVATGSQMVAVSSVWAQPGELDWRVSGVVDPGSPGPDGSVTEQALRCYQELFGFMESCVRAKPQGWWAAHLMPDFPVMDVPAQAVTSQVVEQ